MRTASVRPGLPCHHAAPRPRPGGRTCAPEHVHGAGRLRPRPGGQSADVVLYSLCRERT